MSKVVSLARRRFVVECAGAHVRLGRGFLTLDQARSLSEQLLDVLQFGGVHADLGWTVRFDGKVLEAEFGTWRDIFAGRSEQARLTHEEGLDLSLALAKAVAAGRVAR